MAKIHILPQQGIALIQRQVEKGNDLLSKRPLDSADYSAWESTTKEILNKIFGSDSDIMKRVMSSGGESIFTWHETEAQIEDLRAEGLKTQITLLGSPIELLELETTDSTDLINSKAKQDESAEISLAILSTLLSEHFDLEELKELAFEMNVSFEDLGESIKLSAKSRALVEYMSRRKKLLELLIQVIKERPNVNWKRVLD